MIEMQIGLDGVPSQKNILLGNKYENKDEFIHFDLPSEFDTYNKYVLGAITISGTSTPHTVVLPVTNDTLAVSTGLTYYSGKWELYLMCRENKLSLEDENVDISPQNDEHVFISDSFTGTVNKSKVDLTNIENPPLDSNLKFIYDDLLGLINKVTDSLERGEFDGVSPTLSCEATETGYKVTITDKTGSKAFELKNGEDGRDGTSYEESVEFRTLSEQVRADAEVSKTNASSTQQALTSVNEIKSSIDTIKSDIDTKASAINEAKSTVEAKATGVSEIATQVAEDALLANEAKEAAQSAQTTTEQFKTAAETAKTQAESAKSEAVTTKDEAIAAKTTAETFSRQAQTYAQTAQTQAQNAEQSAQTATTKAQEATSASTSASSSAESAEQAKIEAQTHASNAEESATSAEEALSTVQELATQVDEKVQSLSKYSEDSIALHYNMQRDGKVYQTRFYKFEVNQTSEGTKMLANEGLICEPSTDTVEGRDDYERIPLFQWVHCNYKREADGTPYPVAIEGDDNYRTDGDVDVGSMMMSFWYKIEENGDYIDYYISDSPNEALGLEPWVNCIKQDGTLVPWNIYSSYFSGKASDGNLRSQPNLKPENFQSYQNMIANYGKKGEGYHGAGVDMQTFQILFNAIKYGTKNSQTIFEGCTAYNFQYQASVQRSENDTYFPIMQSQKGNIVVGATVYVGYPSDNSGAPNYDRGVTTMRKYADMAKVLRVEDDGDNAKVYLDCEPFNTTPVTVGTISAQITMSSMHWWSGETDKVIGHHDGSPVSNTDSKHPYRLQGIEFAVGGYMIASDTVMDIQADMSKIVYKLNKGAERSSNIETIKANSTAIGTIPAADGSNDYWIGDVGIKDGAWYPKSKGTGNTTGVADRIYFGGTATSGQREYLMGGALWYGSNAGACFLGCWSGLSLAFWSLLAHD